MYVYVHEERRELVAEKTAQEILKSLIEKDPEIFGNPENPVVGVFINQAAKDLSTLLTQGDRLDWIFFNSKMGREMFWHTSAHLLAQAMLRLFPEAQPTIGPAVDAGFFYDFANLSLSEKDFAKIEKTVQKLVAENFCPQREEVAGKSSIKDRFAGNPYKQELLEAIGEEETVSLYHQSDFSDLCRGPHLPSVGIVKAFKLLKTSAAHWRGDCEREMLTRIYGISFPTQTQLATHLKALEEAKKRDHKLWGAKLGLFSFHEEAPGIPFFHPKGMIMWNLLVDFWRDMHKQAGYEEIRTPQLMSQTLWERSGHWSYYKENMYTCEVEDRSFAIKPMNCPGCMLYYREKMHSYRELPRRIAELGYVHRHEASGSLNGLFRVRGFWQDDAHIFVPPFGVKEEVLSILDLVRTTYETFGMGYRLELSTRPAKSIGSDEEWEGATKSLQEALGAWGQPYNINHGDGAFYGPKIDIHVQDSCGRSWQVGTIQVDFSLPQKFDLEYMDNEGQMRRPAMIHRAIFGSLERFLGLLVEHFAGKFPLWIAPVQAAIIPVAERHNDYAQAIEKRLEKEGFRTSVDLDTESVGKKIRKAQIMQCNYLLVVGDKESESETVNVRLRDGSVLGEVSIESLLQRLTQERDTKSLVPENLV